MRVLLISKKLPFPARDGETIALTNMLDHYKAIGADLTVMSMQTSKHPYGKEYIPKAYSSMPFHLINVEVSNHRSLYLANLFSRRPIHVDRFYQPAFGNALHILLSNNTFDVIQLEGLVLLAYLPVIRSVTAVPVIYRSHNVEGLIWQRLSRSSKGLLFRWYYNLQGKRLWKWERKNFTSAEAVLAISSDDTTTYREWSPYFPVEYLPVSLPDIPVFDSRPQQFTAAFIGALDWLPNRKGIEVFLQEAWPIVRGAIPEATLHLAGRHAPEGWSDSLPEGVVWHGEVENAHAYMQQYAVSIVPLWAGSGLKIKVVEAIAAAIPVVTTPIGAEGLPDGAAEYLHIGATGKDLANATIACLQNQASANKQAVQLLEYVREQLSASAIRGKLRQLLTELSVQ